MTFARQSALLGVAGVVEYAAQLLLPVVLVRHLTQAEFGDYRLFWLIAASAVAVFPFFLPQSLFYLLPRHVGPARAKLLGNTVAWLVVLGILGACLLAAALPYLSESVATLVHTYPSVYLFIALWVAASLFDTLALADGRAEWQARTAIVLSIARTAAMGAAAVAGGDLGSVITVACVFGAVKFTLAFAYACRTPTRNELRVEASLFMAQLRYSAPFALANAIFLLRYQADQWVVATVFSSEVFAIVSIGAVVLAAATLVRQPITNALLPQISGAFKQCDYAAAISHICKGSAAIQLFSLPFFAWLYMVAPDLVTLVYTERYREAADVVRIYVVGLALATLGGGYLMPVLNLGKFSLVLNACGLLVSVIFSYLAAIELGYRGAVAGSMVSLVLMEYCALFLAARQLETKTVELCNLRIAARACACTGLGISAGLLSAAWAGQFGPGVSIAVSSLAFAAVCVLAGKRLQLFAEARRALGILTVAAR